MQVPSLRDVVFGRFKLSWEERADSETLNPKPQAGAGDVVVQGGLARWVTEVSVIVWVSAGVPHRVYTKLQEGHGLNYT